MIPVVKGWSTEIGIEVASLGVQVHGGMGFIEETGAAQHLRDARITTIYEGTTGIQAGDLVGRKIAREGGVTVKGWLAVLKGLDQALAKSGDEDIQVVRQRLAAGAQAVSECVDYVLAAAGKDPNAAFAGAVPFLMLMGIVAGGWQMARAALIAERKLQKKEGDAAFLRGQDQDRALLRRPRARRRRRGLVGHGSAGRRRRDGADRRAVPRRLARGKRRAGDRRVVRVAAQREAEPAAEFDHRAVGRQHVAVDPLQPARARDRDQLSPSCGGRCRGPARHRRSPARIRRRGPPARARSARRRSGPRGPRSSAPRRAPCRANSRSWSGAPRTRA